MWRKPGTVVVLQQFLLVLYCHVKLCSYFGVQISSERDSVTDLFTFCFVKVVLTGRRMTLLLQR